MKTYTYATICAALAALAACGPVQSQAHDHGHSAAHEGHSPGLHAELEDVRRATARYRDHAAALRDGYQLFGTEGPLMGEHWYHPDLVGLPLDIRRPSTLQYADIGGRKVLVGVAYTLYHRPGEPVPEGFTGSDDHWHTHDVARLAEAVVSDRPLLRWVVNRRIQRGKVGPNHDGRNLLTMVHAWVWLDNPDGVFAEQHRALPYLRAGLPAEWAAEGGETSALGVALLAENGCSEDIRRTDRIARLDAGQERSLREACARSAAHVRAALQRSRDARTVNGTAATAWEAYEDARERVLTPRQQERLAEVEDAAMEPHGMH